MSQIAPAAADFESLWSKFRRRPADFGSFYVRWEAKAPQARPILSPCGSNCAAGGPILGHFMSRDGNPVENLQKSNLSHLHYFQNLH